MISVDEALEYILQHFKPLEAETAKIREGLAHKVDLFLTSAGVSMGEYDVVKDVLSKEVSP